MSSRFVKKTVERFWPDGEGEDKDWVDLVMAFSYRQRSAIEKKLVAASVVSGKSEEGKSEVEAATDAANIEALRQAIEAWGGPGFTLEDGTIAPINEETIGSLDRTAEKLLAELQRRMVRPPDFTQPPSPPSPTAGTEDSTLGA